MKTTFSGKLDSFGLDIPKVWLDPTVSPTHARQGGGASEFVFLLIISAMVKS